MEEIYSFLRLIKRFRYVFVIVPIISIIITYFLVKNAPDTYISQAKVSTGIVDDTQQNILSSFADAKGAEINQEFSNMMEMMKMKKILDQVSYQLIIHDLSTNEPFRPKSKFIKELKPTVVQYALKVFREKLDANEGLNLWDKDQNNLYNILRSARYNSDAIRDKIKVYRSQESDFLNIEFESEDPKLSAFVVNTLAEEFIKYYTQLIKANQKKANDFLEELLNQKRDSMENRIAILRNYKIQNRVLNLGEQSSQLYELILQYNDRKQLTIEGIAAKAGALNEIDRKFDGRERGYLEATLTKVNLDIMSIKEEIKSLNDLYIKNDFDVQYKNSIDSLQLILGARINKATDQYIYNPLVVKQDLVQNRLSLGIQLDLAKYSLASMEKELANLNRQFDVLVPHEAEVQSMERDIDVASKEYLDVLNKYNQSSMESRFSVKLNFVQRAMPGFAEPSKKMLLIILSGIISFVFCLVVFFIIFFIDNSIKTPKKLADTTQIPVLGTLGNISGITSLDKIWDKDSFNLIKQDYKSELRSLRFEIENELGDNKILVITSMRPLEGKSVIALSLAYAWKNTNKKVLIIDGNFHDAKISRTVVSKLYLEDYLHQDIKILPASETGGLYILCNKGGDTSLAEIADDDLIVSKINLLEDLFDIIIIETASLDKLNVSKEWMAFGDKILAVFEAGKPISEEKRQNIEYLRNLEGKFAGWVFNKYSSDKT